MGNAPKVTHNGPRRLFSSSVERASEFAHRRHLNPAGDGRSVSRREILPPQIRGCQINADSERSGARSCLVSESLVGWFVSSRLSEDMGSRPVVVKFHGEDFLPPNRH